MRDVQHHAFVGRFSSDLRAEGDTPGLHLAQAARLSLWLGPPWCLASPRLSSLLRSPTSEVLHGEREVLCIPMPLPPHSWCLEATMQVHDGFCWNVLSGSLRRGPVSCGSQPKNAIRECPLGPKLKKRSLVFRKGVVVLLPAPTLETIR